MNTELLNELHDELVPSSGAAETVQGELIRAVSRVGYRYFNDGDVFWEGYGCETAGPSATYLLSMTQVPNLAMAVEKATYTSDGKYKSALDEIIEAVVTYVKSTRGNFTKNDIDSRTFESNWVDDDYDEEDDYFDEEE